MKFDQFLQHEKYSYKIFDTAELLELIRHNKPFIKSLENSIRIYRNHNEFAITDLIKEYLESKPNSITKYSIIYKKNIIISTCRIIYTKKLGYFNLVYVNSDYRNKKICQIHIKHLIDCFKLPKYELHVLKNNAPAIKCYENINFKQIEQSSRKKNDILMRLKK